MHALEESYALAAHAVARVLGGETLTRTLAEVVPARTAAPLRAAILDLAATTLRAYGVPQLVTKTLLTRPVTDVVLLALLYVTVVDLRSHRERAHALVDQAVRAAERLGRIPAKGLVNAVLRNYLRRAEAIEQAIERDEVARYRYPAWWTDLVRRAYPADWEGMLAIADTPPPITLRVNRRQSTRDAYLVELTQAGVHAEPIGEDGVRLLDRAPIETLPGFAAGRVSVQDAAAQRAAELLEAQDGERVLDACAAPGGKSSHILERAAVSLIALEADSARAPRIAENLARLRLSARVIVGDATTPDAWWDGTPFDRILADVPCSASGVVRRHPDIKWLRRRADVASFGRTQAAILDALWRVLAPGGKLLYSTCSVFPAENAGQIDAFCARHADAVRARPAEQILPDALHDGFFYALLVKR